MSKIKNLNIILLLLLFSIQTNAQAWIMAGDDFIGNTDFFNTMTSTCINHDASRFAVSVENLETYAVNYSTQVYSRENGTLVKIGQSIPGDPEQDPEVSSTSLDAEGNTIIIGRASYDFNGVNLSGMIQVHELQNDEWITKGSPIGGEGIAVAFGTSVDIDNDGNTIIVGSEEGIFGGQGGYISVYEWEDNEWKQKGDPIRNLVPFTSFGSSVHISDDGTRIAVGAKGEFDEENDIFNAGSLTLFNWNGSEWAQMGPKFYGHEEMEDLGREGSFSLSNDFNKLVVGYRRHNGSLGKVEVMEWNNGSWSQVGNTLLGKYERFGDGVNISGDGNTISVTGDYAIQMFKLNPAGNTWQLIGQPIREPMANVGYGFLNYDGSIHAAPGSIIIEDFDFVFSALVRFYKFDRQAVSNKNIAKIERFNVYPNPTFDKVNIESEENHSFDRIIVSNILGKQVQEINLNNLESSIDLSAHNKGIYIISLYHGAILIGQEKVFLQ